MFPEKFFDVIKTEGPVAIVTTGKEEAHVSNTWASYLRIFEDRILIPAAGMKVTEENINNNPNVKLTTGSKEVEGLFAMGAGFLIEGTARFITEGAEYEVMKEEFPFLTRVLEVTATSVKQTL